MTVTRTERKSRRIKTRSVQRKQMLAILNAKPTIKSPYKGVSGEIIEG